MIRNHAGAIAGRAQRIDPATGLNSTEARYLAEILEPAQLAGLVLRIDFEPEGLRVAPKGSAGVYWPDFRVIMADHAVEFHEVKARWMDDARAKFKAAAALHPYRFRAAKLLRGGEWELETLGPFPPWSETLASLADRV